MEYRKIVERQQAYVKTGVTRCLSWRKQQLRQLHDLVKENEEQLIDALKKDLGKPALEAWSTEIAYVIGDIKHTLKHLNSWAKPRKVRTALVAQPGRSWVQAEPLGSILIMSAWNYPVQLALAPLVAVISAGNAAIIKPSEVALTVSNLLAKLLPEYLDNNAFSVIQGGVPETTALLEQRFDHIMYTGNGHVARIVMKAAAEHLTPVTLELGGKSPVYVDSSADVYITAQRIAWGKWLNAGQTCIAPDYLLVHKSIRTELVDALIEQVISMFSENAKTSDSYGRIINGGHCERLASYLNAADVIYGGQVDPETCYVGPTIVLNPTTDTPLMTEEIFGPILPIIDVDDFDAAKHFVLERDKPLAAYIFSKCQAQINEWSQSVSAGNQCINDVLMFSAVPDLPFGGVGSSGMGQYSGKAGFDQFSHLKAILKRPFIKDLPLRFAPYTPNKFKWLKRLR